MAKKTESPSVPKKPRQSKKNQLPKVEQKVDDLPVENMPAPMPEAPIEFHPPGDDALTIEQAKEVIARLYELFPELKPIVQVVQLPTDMIPVNKKLFFEAMSALGKGFTYGFTNAPAISKFAKILGAKDRKEELGLWDECQKFLKENK